MPKIHGYDPTMQGDGYWSLVKENTPIGELAVTETIDCLLLKIHNSNGLEPPFVPDRQLKAMYAVLWDEMQRRGLVG